MPAIRTAMGTRQTESTAPCATISGLSLLFPKNSPGISSNGLHFAGFTAPAGRYTIMK